MGSPFKALGDAGLHVEGKLLKLYGRCQRSKYAPPYGVCVHARTTAADGTGCSWQAESMKHLLWVSV